MRVRCVSNVGSVLPVAARDEAAGIGSDTVFPLTTGSEYVVHAITTFRGHCWFFVFDDDGATYPVWKPAALFDVADPAIPSSWVFGYVRRPGRDEYPVISFPEWALDRFFYERLVDGDAEAVATMEQRRSESNEE